MQVHGHRGAAAIYPENTIPGFRYAIEIGADAIEMDIAATNDDVLVVSHDPDLNGRVIHDLMLADVQTHIPTLDAVLALAEGNQVLFNIEIKSFPEHPEYAPPPEVFAKLLFDCLAGRKLEARVMVQSFDFRTLREMRKLAPGIRLGALWEGPPRSLVDIARDAGASFVGPRHTLISPKAVAEAHAAGLEVIPWTANRSDDWARLIEAGVDGIITDDPEALLKYLHRM